MTDSVRIEASAAKQIARLDVEARRLVVEQIDRLASDPHVGTELKGEFQGLRRVRQGPFEWAMSGCTRAWGGPLGKLGA